MYAAEQHEMRSKIRQHYSEIATIPKDDAMYSYDGISGSNSNETWNDHFWRTEVHYQMIFSYTKLHDTNMKFEW